MNIWITLRTILKILYARCQFETYRSKQNKNKVIIDGLAIISGVESIYFGSGTAIGKDAIVASTNDLSWGTKLNSKGSGIITIGERCNILPRAIIATYGGNITIGNDVSINPGCILYGHGGLKIGNATRIAANTVIIPANHRFSADMLIMEQGLDCLGIKIGSDVWIGSGVTILDGVTIEDGAIIGAGAVVTKDVKQNDIIAGIPGRKINSRQ
ncbi:hypothetical protein MCAMS1_02098 [biofilm metagenome]